MDDLWRDGPDGAGSAELERLLRTAERRVIALADLGLRSPAVDRALLGLRDLVVAGDAAGAQQRLDQLADLAEGLLRGRGRMPCLSGPRRPAVDSGPSGERAGPADGPGEGAEELVPDLVGSPDPAAVPVPTAALRRLVGDCLAEALVAQESRLREAIGGDVVALDQRVDRVEDLLERLDRRLDGLLAAAPASEAEPMAPAAPAPVGTGDPASEPTDRELPSRPAPESARWRQPSLMVGEQTGARLVVDGGLEDLQAEGDPWIAVLPGTGPLEAPTSPTVRSDGPAGVAGDHHSDQAEPPAPTAAEESDMSDDRSRQPHTETIARLIDEVDLILPGDTGDPFDSDGSRGALQGVPVARTMKESLDGDDLSATNEYAMQASESRMLSPSALEEGARRPTAERVQPVTVAPRTGTDATDPIDRTQLKAVLLELLPDLLKDRRIQQQIFGLIASECLFHPSALGELTGLRDLLRREIERAAEGLRRSAG